MNRFPNALFAFLAGLSIVAGIGTSLTAADSVNYVCTKPEGYVTVNITTGTSTIFGLPLETPAVFRFTVGSVTDDTVTFDDADFETEQFITTGSYWLRVITGNQAGRHLLITDNTEKTLTVDLTDGTSLAVPLTQANWALQSGDIVEIAPTDTLKSLFGGILKSGSFVLMADTFALWDGAKWIAYYKWISDEHWYLSTDIDKKTPMDDMVIHPYYAWAITRRVGNPTLTQRFWGSVPEQPVMFRHHGGSSELTAARFPVDQSLSDFRYGNQTLWQSGDIVFFADTIGLWSGSQWVAYWENTQGNWRKTGDATDRSDLKISLGTPIMVTLRGARSGKNVFLTQPLPYPNPRE